MGASREKLELTRLLDAPRELVFEAWSRPEHLVKWMAPDGFVCSCAMDFRVGGAVSIRLVGMGMDHTVTGVYEEIVVPERIVFTQEFSDIPGHPMRLTVTLVDHGAKTELRVQQVYPAFAKLTPAQQALIQPRIAGAPIGWGQTLDHLSEFVRK
jgi:uncharacterized protein YndB with AHSA1/START domain